MGQLVDAYGRKVDTSILKKEVAGPALAGLRNPWWTSIANFLDPERLGAYLNELDSGNHLNYLILAHEMEERYSHYYSVLSTRKLGVAGLPFNIEASSEEVEDKKAADLCRDMLNDEIVQPMLLELMDALSKGYSVSEILWETEGKNWSPREITHRDARWFRYDLLTGQELRQYDMQDPAFGIPLAPYHFIKFEPKLRTGLPIKRGLARLALGSYMMTTYSFRDWLAFCQVYGMPLRLGKYPPTATSAERRALFEGISGLGTDAAGIVPSNMEIEFMPQGTSSGGNRIFQELCEYLDKLVSKVVLGQTATTEGTPGKLGAEDAQERVREDIKTNDARQLAACLRRDLIRPIVDLNMGPRDRNKYPKITLQEKKSEDLAQLATAISVFIDRGLPVAQKKILVKFGLEPPEEGEPLLHAATKGGGAEGTSDGKSTHDVEAETPDMGPDHTTKGNVRAPSKTQEDDQNTHDNVEKRSLKKPVKQGEPGKRVFGTAKAHRCDDFEIATARVVASPLSEELVTKATGGWRKTVGPMLDQIKAAVRGAKTHEEAIVALSKLKLDKSAATEEIATTNFLARALGDAGKK